MLAASQDVKLPPGWRRVVPGEEAATVAFEGPSDPIHPQVQWRPSAIHIHPWLGRLAWLVALGLAIVSWRRIEPWLARPAWSGMVISAALLAAQAPLALALVPAGVGWLSRGSSQPTGRLEAAGTHPTLRPSTGRMLPDESG